jgi:hypothetical protein
VFATAHRRASVEGALGCDMPVADLEPIARPCDNELVDVVGSDEWNLDTLIDLGCQAAMSRL